MLRVEDASMVQCTRLGDGRWAGYGWGRRGYVFPSAEAAQRVARVSGLISWGFFAGLVAFGVAFLGTRVERATPWIWIWLVLTFASNHLWVYRNLRGLERTSDPRPRSRALRTTLGVWMAIFGLLPGTAGTVGLLGGRADSVLPWSELALGVTLMAVGVCLALAGSGRRDA